MNESALLKGKDSKGRAIVSLICGTAYTITKSGDCELQPEYMLQKELQYYRKGIEYRGHYRPSLLQRDIDMYVWREHTDLVIQGVVRSDKPQTEMSIDLDCYGARTKLHSNIVATGDRYVQMDGDTPQLTAPEPFTEMPIRYDKAYGGTDEKAEELHGDPQLRIFRQHALSPKEARQSSVYSYPRNPAGKGYLVDKAGIEGLPWPNLEFADDRLRLDTLVAPLNHWGTRPYPAAFDWFSHAWFPRFAFFGEFPKTFDDAVPAAELERDILPAGLRQVPLFERSRHGFTQGAHPFLSRQRFLGDEHIQVTAMSRDGSDLLVKLPQRLPEMEIQLAGASWARVRPELDLVLIEAEVRTLTLLWRGSKRLSRPLRPNWRALSKYKVSWR